MHRGGIILFFDDNMVGFLDADKDIPVLLTAFKDGVDAGIFEKRYICYQCGTKWKPRTPHPRACPECGSELWDKKPEKVRRGRKQTKVRNGTRKDRKTKKIKEQ